MPNLLITPKWVLRRVGRIAVNNLKFANNVDRSYNGDYEEAGAKVGDTIYLRLPWQPITTKGQAFQEQAVIDRIVPVTLTDQAQCAVGFSTRQMTVDVDDYMGRYIEPGAVQIANTMDFDGLTRIPILVGNAVGTLGTAPTDNATYLAANTLLSGLACPPRRMVITSPDMQAAITASNFSLRNPPTTISDSFETGVYSTDVLGFKNWYWDQNVANFVAGTYGGTPLVNGANQTGTSLITDGWSTGSVVKAGTKITLGSASGGAASTGVFPVNPQNRQALKSLQSFTVLQTANESGGAMTLQISPSLITAGAFQDVTASPVDNAVITVLAQSGAQGQLGLAWAKEAVVMVTADLVYPEGGAIAERISSKPLGFSLRFVKQYNILSDRNLARIDNLYGWQAYRPEWVCVVFG